MKSSAMTQSFDCPPNQSPPRIMRASVHRVSHRELRCTVCFSMAITEDTRIDVTCGYLCLREATGAYTIALSLPAPLWKGWNHGPVQPTWNEARTSFDVSLVLPEKWERIPEAPDVVAAPPDEAPWPFMTDESWRKATGPWG